MSQIEPRSFYTLNSKILNKKKGNMSRKKTINVALIIISLFVLSNTSRLSNVNVVFNQLSERIESN